MCSNNFLWNRFGNWLITINDTIGEQVLSHYNVPSVYVLDLPFKRSFSLTNYPLLSKLSTVQGNAITKGNLTGGYRPTTNNLMTHKFEFQQLKVTIID
jgi:hypothetical protein